MSQVKYELVLPCYNEAKNLRNIVVRCLTVARQRGMEKQFCLVLVNNGSLDNSAEVFRELLAEKEIRPFVRLVEVPQNQGYGYGIWQGLLSSQSEILGWSHADQQCDPDDFFRAVEKLEALETKQTPVLVKGCRSGRAWPEIFVSRVFDWVASILLRKHVYEINAQPKVFRRSLLQTCPRPPKDFAFDVYILHNAIKAGYRIVTIPVQFRPRGHGLSNWAFSLKNRAKTIFQMVQYLRELAAHE